MNSNITVPALVAWLVIRYVSDLGPHIKVAQILLENILFLCPHCSEKIRSAPFESENKGDLGHICL